RTKLWKEAFLAHQLLAGARQQPILRRHLARYPLDLGLGALLHRIVKIAPRFLEASFYRLVGFSELRLGQSVITLGEVQPVLFLDDFAPGQGGANRVFEVVELASLCRDEDQHVAIDARRAAPLKQDLLRLHQSL